MGSARSVKPSLNLRSWVRAFMSGISLPTSFRTRRMEGNLVRGILRGEGECPPVNGGVCGGVAPGRGVAQLHRKQGTRQRGVDNTGTPASTPYWISLAVLHSALFPKPEDGGGGGGRQVAAKGHWE